MARPAITFDERICSLPARILERAKSFGAASLVAIEDAGQQLTYRDLPEAIIRSAAAFLAFGLQRGDRVALWAPNSLRWIIAALGLQAAGGVLVPLNTRFKGKEAAYILNKSGARLLLTVDRFLGNRYVEMLQGETLLQLQKVVSLTDCERTTNWDDFQAAGEGFAMDTVRQRLNQLAPGDFSDMIFTSGTTGSPKGVMTSHEQNLQTYEMYSGLLGLRPGDRMLIVNPFFNTFGYKAGWYSALSRGATVLPHTVFDAAEVVGRIEQDRITVLPGPPALYQSILALPNYDQHDLSSLRLAVTGSSTIPTELIRRMRDDLGFKTVLTAYGMTETSGVISMCSAADDVETIATTSGKAVDGVEVRIVDDQLQDVAAGKPGEIWVRGFNIMKGYFEDPEETAQAIDSEGWLHTGDIAVRDARGYLRITDRKKDLFIVGGFNCSPAEIESILLTHPNIVQAAVIGIPDARLGEVAKAFVVSRQGSELTTEDVVQWSRLNMANYKVPRTVEVRQNLPMNAAGKVQKFVLRDECGMSRGMQ